MVEQQMLLAPEIYAPIHERAVALLDDVRAELRRLRGK
jgi:hypothetical protein